MTTTSRRRLVAIAIALALAAVAVGGYVVHRSRSAGLPQPGSSEYEQATRYFHRGLAGLQVGLLDGAIEDFTRAAALAAGEPAIWANLGLTHLRLGAFDAANGSVVFEQDRIPEGRGFTASPWAYDDKVFCLNEDGVTFVFEAGDTMKLLHTNVLEDDDLGMATPAIAGDRLLIRTGKRLYSIRNAS